ncbi:16S rRNA (guanine(527)-N(7))-methyltransferase RsmG [Erysipelothrix sp. HDW6C]|uniref:16S rRNA (guanine(527)-N(7))-methyltransferase RsmG n=1 Tax=Erysipelothrix sp. HDW6C TaxID=2714930 RepID=UPI0014073185|nr:16S rRNA (guanine(527)-N(7))-methyltransferase RsmG [Erysipelothrix sp. HDW6C]QIK69054.1 16S rRNA (guanine(527)-N(7))-methyltransferase RsmG [Erysipelothrix sp. HDW6C]
MTLEEFITQLEPLGIVASPKQKEQFLTYKNLIQEVNKVLNLTGIDDDAGIYHKHFYDSLLIAPAMKPQATLADIGSGAGFPGIVIAIARPDIHVTCIEPTTKRTNFLSRVVEACNLSNVTILNERAEDVIVNARESFDYATARAVAYLDILSELCIPFIKVGGVFLAMKGARGLEEYEESKKAITILGGELLRTHEFNDDVLGERFNLEIVKIKNTPKKYPRSYAKIKKTPLSGRAHD